MGFPSAWPSKPSKAPKTWAFLYSLFTMSTGARLSRAKETAVSHLGTGGKMTGGQRFLEIGKNDETSGFFPKRSPGNPVFFFLEPYFSETAMDLMDEITWILIGNHVDD